MDALRVQRLLGSTSPSLAVDTTPHHFSMAALVALLTSAPGEAAMDEMLVSGLAAGNRILAFGFAETEKHPDAGVLSPSLRATEDPEGVRVSGVTRTGGLGQEMDVLVTTVMAPRWDETGEEPALMLVPAEAEGLTVGGSGRDGERVTLDGVLLPPDLLLRDSSPDGQLDVALTTGFLWLQLLTTGSCLGAASGLVERVLLEDRVPESDRIGLLVEIEGAMSAAEGVARRIDDGSPDESALAHALHVRYHVQDCLARVVPRAVELLNGLGSTAPEEVDLFTGCVDGLALHPPARSRMTGALSAHLAGGPLTIT
ncbi:acyl-CoA dehydrogenase [Streptomyces sp. 71268]|uniref:acyl-CoA dehydrogenase n=1 Tax=Streptomyces sp. 71268 TaxID=3002640 RepID=UPI0032B2CD78